MNDLNVIFLDCDGVLNSIATEHRFRGTIGFDRRKIQKLKEIIDATDAKIVLSSTWKLGWEKADKKCNQTPSAHYLDEQLARERLYIYDKTEDDGPNRGQGILNWLDKYCRTHPRELIRYIIIDDDMFDFQEVGIADRVLRTSFYSKNGGLLRSHIPIAIEMLRKQAPYTRNIKLQPCPFCGGPVHFIICDDEGNIHNEEGYESDSWSGLGYMIGHEASDVPEGIICPISTHPCESLGMHIYNSREEIAQIWGEANEDEKVD